MKNVRQFRKTILGAGCALALTALVPFAFGDGNAAPSKAYPLKTCVVSGEKLGEMGTPYVFTYQGREVKLCCKGCLKDFNKEPAKYLKKLDDAQKAASQSANAVGSKQGHGCCR